MSQQSLNIVFHGGNAANFRAGFEALINPAHTLSDVSDTLDQPGERERFEQADVVVGVALKPEMPRPLAARLYHAPAAGTDAIDLSCLPEQAALCNCFGHEQAIAEYVFAALLQAHVPLAQADADLRQQRWTFWAGQPGALRTELGEQTLGLVGYGHIAKAIAQRAKAFGMRVLVANRSAVSDPQVDQAFALDQLSTMAAQVDALIVTLPLTTQTTSLVNQAVLAALPRHARIVNVGRGPVVDEQALFDELAARRIGGAIIDTWYQYPAPTHAEGAPSKLDFASLPNVLMTPHMSGWTAGTVRRRQQTMADNIARLQRGEPLINVVRAPLR
jgi:phosphoglycerate dehydrogenase-like enzyme